MYASPQDLAKIYRWTVGYVYKLAHTHGWRRITLDRRVRYSRADVEATFWADR